MVALNSKFSRNICFTCFVCYRPSKGVKYFQFNVFNGRKGLPCSDVVSIESCCMMIVLTFQERAILKLINKYYVEQVYSSTWDDTWTFWENLWCGLATILKWGDKNVSIILNVDIISLKIFLVITQERNSNVYQIYCFLLVENNSTIRTFLKSTRCLTT